MRDFTIPKLQDQTGTSILESPKFCSSIVMYVNVYLTQQYYLDSGIRVLQEHLFFCVNSKIGTAI